MRGEDKKMINYKLLMKNRKAISPIFATLILIAIAVIAGVVVYTFTSGTLSTMTGGGTAGTEKVTVQAVQYTATGTKLTIYAQSQTGPVTITNLIIKDSSGKVVGTGTELVNATPVATPIGSTLTTLYSTITWTTGPVAGSTYTASLVSQAGGNFVSPSFSP
jgi:flagellin-like protein